MSKKAREKLAQWFNESGVRRDHFAARCGVSPPLVSNWLSGHRIPQKEARKRISEITRRAVPMKIWEEQDV